LFFELSDISLQLSALPLMIAATLRQAQGGESRSHTNNKTVIINRYYNLSRLSRFAPFSPDSMPYALCPMLYAFLNPQLSFGLPPFGRVPSFAIRIPQSSLGLAWFLQFEKTTKIGSMLKQE
jgi:hypothetical protein